jgi:ferredoxin/flavodoxin---NADP+ reductase
MNARLPTEVTLPPPKAPKWHEERVLRHWHWTPQLVSFRISRDQGYQFVPGRYARLGLADASGEVVWRPFSMVSSVNDDFLEFLVVLVDGGEFSRRLATLKVGDPVLVEKANFGFLTLDQLASGETLWMLASGSGLGPFLSILRDQAAWRIFKHLVLVHSVRQVGDLAYRDDIIAMREAHAVVGIGADLRYFPVVTREAMRGALSARIPQLIEDGRLESAAGLGLEVDKSRVMVCGNPDLAKDMRHLLVKRGFATSRRGVPGQMAFEKYW